MCVTLTQALLPFSMNPGLSPQLQFTKLVEGGTTLMAIVYNISVYSVLLCTTAYLMGRSLCICTLLTRCAYNEPPCFWIVCYSKPTFCQQLYQIHFTYNILIDHYLIHVVDSCSFGWKAREIFSGLMSNTSFFNLQCAIRIFRY